MIITDALELAQPTVVLVHGAFADASEWDSVVSGLQQHGHQVVAAANPLRGLASDSAYVASVVESVGEPVILVGHSYGGSVISNAARQAHNVRALVYCAAFLPDEGESTESVLDPHMFPGSRIGPETTITRPFPNRSVPGGSDVDIYLDPAAFPEVFAGDVTAMAAALMAATQRPLARSANTEPSGPPAWRTLPSWDLITVDDQAVPVAGQRFMAERAGAVVTEIHSSHAVMVSHPEAVIDIVERASQATMPE